MLTHRATLALSLLLVCAINASQELQEAIVKTDIEAVKNILPTVSLNTEQKQHLIDLANDIMLMRLKTEEIYTFRDISNLDEKSLKQALSDKVIQEIKEINTTAGLWGCAVLLSFATACISMPYADPYFNSTIVSKIGSACLIASGVGMLISSMCLAYNDGILQGKVRSNLRQLYCDSIEIKSLIANTAVTI
jgi:hypothetical protein